MATSDWAIPTGKAITGATYIKDTDDNIAATIEDLRDWCNNANGTYTDWTLTGLRTDFLDINTAQTITAVKTIDTLGAVDFTGGELRVGGVAVTSTAAELNLLDGVTSTTSELNILDGVTATTAELNILDGVTSTTAELNILDGVTLTTSDINKLVSGTWTPTGTIVSNISSLTTVLSLYQRVGDIVSVTTRVTVDPVSTGATKFTLSLPVASNFTLISTDVTGTFSNSAESTYGEVYANTTTDTIEVKFYPQVLSVTYISISAQYIVK